MAKIVFLNIGWMIDYRGITPLDTISGGGSYEDNLKEEAWNFKKVEIGGVNYCFGYVQPVTGGRDYYDATIDISKIDPTCTGSDYLENVIVVWMAPKPQGKGRYIVGWYKNATVFRNYQRNELLNHGYYVKAKFEDCCKVHVSKRLMEVPVATKENKGYSGQSNVWYADSLENGVPEFRDKVLNYIENH